MTFPLTYKEFPFQQIVFLRKPVNCRDLHVTIYDEMGTREDSYIRLSEVNRRLHNASVEAIVGKFSGNLRERVSMIKQILILMN